MSYCRFSEGDVYMYASVRGGIECCACRLAEKVPTIFTPGKIDETDPRWRLFTKNGELICKKCKSGCDECMMHGNLTFETYQEAFDHLVKHKEAGDIVPDRAFKSLRRDAKKGEPLKPTLCKCGEVAYIVDTTTGKYSCGECMEKEMEKEKKDEG